MNHKLFKMNTIKVFIICFCILFSGTSSTISVFATGSEKTAMIDDVPNTLKEAKTLKLAKKYSFKLDGQVIEQYKNVGYSWTYVNDVDCFKFKKLDSDLDYQITIKGKGIGDVEFYSSKNNKSKLPLYNHETNPYDIKKGTYKYICYEENHSNEQENVLLRFTIHSLKKGKWCYIKVLGEYAEKGKYKITVTPKPRGATADYEGFCSGIMGHYTDTSTFSVYSYGAVSGYEIQYRESSPGNNSISARKKQLRELEKKKWKKKKITSKKKKIYIYKNKTRSLTGSGEEHLCRTSETKIRTWYKYKGKKYYSDWDNSTHYIIIF